MKKLNAGMIDYFSKCIKFFTIGKIFVIIKKMSNIVMKKCRLSITTSVNGEESSIIRQGTMELMPLSAKLFYQEDNARICVFVKDNSVRIQREGDYTLSLLLQESIKNQGSIGILGSEGGIEVFAHKVNYAIGRDSLMLSLHYDLLFGQEKQEMKLRLLACLDK